MSDKPISGPEVYVFILSRRPLVLAMLAFALPALALMAAGVVLLVHHREGSFRACWTLGFWMLVPALSLLSIVAQRAPRSVCLTESGAYLEWPDREEHWPWETVTWRIHGSHGRELVPTSRGCGLSAALIPRRERTRFWEVVSHFAGDRVGAHEVAALAAGEPIRYGRANRWPSLILLPLFCGGGLVWCSWVVRDSLRSLAHSPAHAAPGNLWYAYAALPLGAVYVLVLYGALRAALYEVRFLPDGVEDRWLAWRRVLPYASIDCVTCRHTGPWGLWVRLRAGKRAIKIGGRLPHFWGAVRLLRERAPQAVWEERGG